MSTFSNIVQFGTALVAEDDLDPVYTLLRQVDTPVQCRVSFHYWCVYDMGAAALCADAPGWDGLEALVHRQGGPRGAERRHFRGVAAQRAVAEYRRKFSTPVDAVGWLLARPNDFGTVLRRAKTLPLFGPWIAFKVADMAVQLFGATLGTEPVESFFYEEPRKGAQLAAPELGLEPEAPLPHKVQALLGRMGPLVPNWNPARPLGVLEAETVFCKYKTHRTSSYRVGQDRAHLEHVLRREASSTGAVLLRALEDLRLGPEACEEARSPLGAGTTLPPPSRGLSGPLRRSHGGG